MLTFGLPFKHLWSPSARILPDEDQLQLGNQMILGPAVARLLDEAEAEAVMLRTVTQDGLNATQQQVWGRKAEEARVYCPRVATSGTRRLGSGTTVDQPSVIFILDSFHKCGDHIQLCKAGRVIPYISCLWKQKACGEVGRVVIARARLGPRVQSERWNLGEI